MPASTATTRELPPAFTAVRVLETLFSYVSLLPASFALFRRVSDNEKHYICFSVCFPSSMGTASLAERIVYRYIVDEFCTGTAWVEGIILTVFKTRYPNLFPLDTPW